MLQYWVLYHLNWKLTENSDWLEGVTLFHNYFITVASRFKIFKNYLYQYTTDSKNAWAGTVNGVQMSCQVVTVNTVCILTVADPLTIKLSSFFFTMTWAVPFFQVEIDVPQPCKFVLKTRDCSLGEILSIKPDRKPVFVKPSSSDDFSIAMNRLAINILHIIWNIWHMASLNIKKPNQCSVHVVEMMIAPQRYLLDLLLSHLLSIACCG